jgi:hypothetical protein
MDLSRDEMAVLEKFRSGKRFAENNKQATLEICILPGGRVSLIKVGYQEKIETGKQHDPR